MNLFISKVVWSGVSRSGVSLCWIQPVPPSLAALYQKSQQVLGGITLKGLDQSGQGNFGGVGVLVFHIASVATPSVGAEAHCTTWSLRTGLFVFFCFVMKDCVCVSRSV